MRKEPAISGATRPPVEQSPATQISNMVVALVHSYTGRGPTQAWTSIDRDLISVMLRDTLTKGERCLVSNSRAQLVPEMRKGYQNTMRDDLVAGVEQISERNVTAFLSDNHMDPDIAIESFVLEPSSEGQQQPAAS